MASKHGSKSPRNKPYKRRDINLYAAGNAIASNQGAMLKKAHEVVLAERLAVPLDDDQQTALCAAWRLAFDALLKGRGNESDWNTVVCSLNIALVLSENGFGPECEAQIIDALDGVFRSKLRQGRRDKWGLDGPAIQAIKEAYRTHEAQLEFATGAEIMAARDEVNRRIDSGNVYRDASQ